MGLHDWHVHTHTDGRVTALRQELGYLALVIDRQDGRVEWLVEHQGEAFHRGSSPGSLATGQAACDHSMGVLIGG